MERIRKIYDALTLADPRDREHIKLPLHISIGKIIFICRGLGRWAVNKYIYGLQYHLPMLMLGPVDTIKHLNLLYDLEDSEAGLGESKLKIPEEGDGDDL